MLKTNSILCLFYLMLTAVSLSLLGCSRGADAQLSGIWRADDALPAKNLVLEFVPGGSGQVFSGSIIGFPTDAPIKWDMRGDQITLKTLGDEPVVQTITVLSQEAGKLVVEVNRTKLILVRVDDVIDADAVDLLSTGSGE